MGCFSWMCKECGESILSSSADGDHAILFLLLDGKVIEYMQGEYDSYGRVFNDDKKKSIDWSAMTWDTIVGYDCGNNPKSGIAAVHTKCFNGKVPTTKSAHDPNQGWQWCISDPECEKCERKFYGNPFDFTLKLNLEKVAV
jgi:hypothetical protein